MICSSVNRLGFMVHPFPGDGLYPFLEEFAGLRPAAVWPLDQENAGIRRPRPVWEENFRKASVLFVTAAMYRPYGLAALPESTRTSVIRRQEKRRRTRSACRQALAP